MGTMNIYYLIDFENVREMGISALSPTDKTDHIYVFYTDNASKLSMDAFLGHDGEIKFIKVAAGKQSLDMHLISVLGFLLRDQGEDKRYVIVSKDGGYDNVIRFWSSKGFAVSRDSISVSVSEQAVSSDQPVMPKKNKKNPANRRNNLKKKRERKEELGAVAAAETAKEQRESEQLEDKPFDQEKEIPEKEEEPAVDNAAQMPEKSEEPQSEQEDALTLVEEMDQEPAKPKSAKGKKSGKKKEKGQGKHSDVKKKNKDLEEEEPFGSEKETETDSTSGIAAVKEEAAEENQGQDKQMQQEEESAASEEKKEEDGKKEKQDKEQASSEIDAHTAMNLKIMALLKDKTDVNTSGAITSIIVRNMDAKNYKQVIYRQMVKKFGQKEGLKNYNLIKKEI